MVVIIKQKIGIEEDVEKLEVLHPCMLLVGMLMAQLLWKTVSGRLGG